MKIGNAINDGLESYGAHWKEWLLVSLVYLVTVFVAHMLCVIPGLLIIGPMMAGMFACALRAQRGGTVETEDLFGGFKRAGSTVVAGLVMSVTLMLPMLAIYVLMMAPALLMAVGADPERPSDQAAGLFAASFAGMFIFQFIAIMAYWIFSLWFATRIAFVFPILADRDISWSEAYRLSFRATKSGFWEVLLLVFIAWVFASIGSMFCYVGMLVTLPIGFSIMAAAYRERFEEPGADSPAPSEPPVPSAELG